MFTTNRTPYVTHTPDATHFGSDVPLARLDRSSSPSTSSREPSSSPVGLSAARTWWKTFSSRYRETVNNNTGLLLIALAQAFGSMMNVFVKKLNSLDVPVPTLELIAVRMAITWVCCVIYMLIVKLPDPILGPKGVRLLLAFRGVCGFTGVFGLYYALQYLSLSDATILQFLAPMFTAVAGALILKEDFKRSQALASLCSLFGVILIARPEFLFGRRSTGATPGPQPMLEGRDGTFPGIESVTPAQRLAAVGLSVLSVLGATGAYITIRAIGKRAQTLHTVVAYATQCVIYSITAILVTRTPIVIPTRVDWMLMLLAIGIFGFLLQLFITMGLQRESAGRGTMAIYVQIIFATINDLVFFHSTPSLLSTIGTIIIITSAIYVAISKENPGLHKRHNSILPPQDVSLEEGLLAQEEDAEVAKVEEADNNAREPIDRAEVATDKPS